MNIFELPSQTTFQEEIRDWLQRAFAGEDISEFWEIWEFNEPYKHWLLKDKSDPTNEERWWQWG